jgi:hypothetical protein
MPVGMVTTYDLSVGVQLQVDPLIEVITPFDVPLVGTNGADGRSTLARDTMYEKKVEWMDEELLTPRTTLGANYTAAGTFITVAAGERERFQTGDLIRVDAETMRVTGYGTTADTLTIATWAGSNANHTAGAVLVGVGSALPEGTDPPDPRTRDRVMRHNVSEIFGPVQVQVSATEQAIRKYGLPMSEFDYQIANRTKEQFVALEQALLYGTRVDDASGERRSMGGLDYYITTNIDATTTDITEAALTTQLETAFNLGGGVTTLLVPAGQKRKISAWGGTLVRFSQGERVRGFVVDTIETDFGVINIILNRWLRKSDVFGFNREQATLMTLRPFTFEMLAKTGDSVKGMVVGEYSFTLKRQMHAFKMTALQ